MATAKKAPCKKAECKCKKAAAPAKKAAPAKVAAPKVVKITKTPTKAAIIDMVAEKVQITKPQAKAAIEAVVEKTDEEVIEEIIEESSEESLESGELPPYTYTEDKIIEMLESGVNPQKCNVVIFTGGANSWALNIQSNVNTVLNLNSSGSDFDIIATTQSAANMGDPNTFLDFLNYAYSNFPAEHYSLICWDHGGGSLFGFGSDELYSGDGLSLQEMEYALKSSPFASKKLDFLGFDACLMATMEAS